MIPQQQLLEVGELEGGFVKGIEEHTKFGKTS